MRIPEIIAAIIIFFSIALVLDDLSSRITTLEGTSILYGFSAITKDDFSPDEWVEPQPSNPERAVYQWEI